MTRSVRRATPTRYRRFTCCSGWAPAGTMIGLHDPECISDPQTDTRER